MKENSLHVISTTHASKNGWRDNGDMTHLTPPPTLTDCYYGGQKVNYTQAYFQ